MREGMIDFLLGRRRRVTALIVPVLLIGVAIWLVQESKPRKPPNIFDTPVDGVLDFMIDEDFSRLSIDERMKFLADVMERFRGLDQEESAVASSFLAGLTGPANERLVANARVLGKDILVQGAGEFLALSNDADRAAFLDQWIVKWARMAEGMGGSSRNLTDTQILDRLASDGRRDLERGIEIDARMAQEITDFWDRDVASVASPKEQAQIYQFLPALRSHILNRKQ